MDQKTWNSDTPSAYRSNAISSSFGLGIPYDSYPSLQTKALLYSTSIGTTLVCLPLTASAAGSAFSQ
ncbi:hypothetical protein H6P81_013633 [Aristolochia fimbriata]|uniref:NADH-plastoquinone oxidoreductase subunit 5 n=1 Tax=Aristolochia fimbriata TaxID=158543 RepID=A0AAV7EHF4_ARIFI|nr:hypothetical protein H6P81_013633 [Aristolochia fimbriata]